MSLLLKEQLYSSVSSESFFYLLEVGKAFSGPCWQLGHSGYGRIWVRMCFFGTHLPLLLTS